MTSITYLPVKRYRVLVREINGEVFCFAEDLLPREMGAACICAERDHPGAEVWTERVQTFNPDTPH